MSPRGVSVLDRAGSPLRAPFLTGFRHFCRQIGFNYAASACLSFTTKPREIQKIQISVALFSSAYMFSASRSNSGEKPSLTILSG